MKKYLITLDSATERSETCKTHLRDVGFDEVDFMNGVDAARWGLMTSHDYPVDNPSNAHFIPRKQVGCHLSHWITWQIALRQEQDVVSIMEDDVRLAPDWSPRLANILAAAPEDWDMILLGHCNAADKPTTHVQGQLFDVRYPHCTHWYLVRKKALPFLIQSQQKSWAQVDVALYFNSYPHLKVYTAIPRLAYQHDTDLHD